MPGKRCTAGFRRGASMYAASAGGADTRTLPRNSAAPVAARIKPCRLSSILRACGTSALPAAVSDQPFGKRSNSLTASAASSASMRRATVVCSTPAARAAADSVPASCSARK
jgi:hypothetical protein